MTQRLLKPSEASTYLRVAEPTLRNSRFTGTLCGRQAPLYIKMGNRTVLYDQQDLDNWLDALPRFTSTSQSAAAQEAA